MLMSDVVLLLLMSDGVLLLLMLMYGCNVALTNANVQF